MRDLHLAATGRVGFDEIDKLPGNFARRNALQQEAQGGKRDHSLEQTANGATRAHVHALDFQGEVVLHGLQIKINIVDADYFAAVDVDDLLVEEIAGE